MASALPARIGPYRVERLLGRGGAAEVFEAVGAAGERVAVKLMIGFRMESEVVSRRRFALESSVRIEHPNIVRTLAEGTHEGSPYLVQELLRGTTLAQELRKELLSARQVGELLIGVGEGLHAMHQAGFLHRDIKLGNLFLAGPERRPKIIDLGAVLALEHEGERLTNISQVIGTPSYIAPELIRSETALPQSDLWSLGIVAYHALTGVSPFRRDSSVATMTAILFDPLRPLWELAPTVDRGVAEVVHRLLRKDAAERFSSGEALAHAVRALGPLSDARRHSEPSGTSESVTRAASTGYGSGERRLVVVLVAAGVDDPRAAERAILHRGGRSYRLLGGQLLGLFGGTTWNGDEPYRATFAALALREFAERVGVAVGTADIGTAAPSGESVILAERAAESRAQGIALDPSALAFIDELPDETPSGALYDLEDLVLWNELRPGPVPLAGRSAEISRADEAIDDLAFGGDSFSLLFTGPAGIGKTRLLAEIATRARDAELSHVLSVKADPLGRDRSLSLVAALLRVALAEAGPLEAALEALVARFSLAGEDLLPFLRIHLGLGVPQTEAVRAAQEDPALMSDRSRVAFSEVLGALVAEGPTLIIVDDYDIGDEASKSILRELATRQALGFVISSRNDDILPPTTELAPVELRGLSPRGTQELLTSLLREAPPREEVQRIRRHTGGNPLFLEQLAQAGWVGSAGRARLALPATVHAAAQSRLDSLPAHLKELCKHIALCARPVTARLLRAIGVASPESGLRELEGLRLLRAGDEPGQGVRLRSEILAEVATAMIPDVPRAALHLRIARALEGLPEVNHAEVAAHLAAAGDDSLAALAWAQATAAAQQRGDALDVLHCAEEAQRYPLPRKHEVAVLLALADAARFLRRPQQQLEALERALERTVDPATVARIYLGLTSYWLRRGKHERSRLEALRALASAGRSRDQPLLVQARLRLAEAEIYGGSLDAAAAELSHARQDAADHGWHAGDLADVEAQLASARGQLQIRLEAFERSAEGYARIGDPRRETNARLNLADLRNRVGDYHGAVEAITEALMSCRKVGNRLAEGYALLNLGYAQGALGRTDEALGSLEGARGLARISEDARLEAFSRLYALRVSATGPGRVALAELLDEAHALAEDDSGGPTVRTLARAWAAELYLRARNPAEALTHSAAALASVEELGRLEEDEAEVFLARGRALHAAGDPQGARAIVREALRRLDEAAAAIADDQLRASFLERVLAHQRLRELGLALAVR